MQRHALEQWRQQCQSPGCQSQRVPCSCGISFLKSLWFLGVLLMCMLTSKASPLLCGTQVWMPDDLDTQSSSARSQSMRWDDTPSSASAVLSQDETEFAAASGRQAPAGPQGHQQKGPPNWWDPPPRIHVDQRYKEQVRLSRAGSTVFALQSKLCNSLLCVRS